MEVSFTEFVRRMAHEYDHLNGLEKRINQFFNSFRHAFETQPAAQLLSFLNNAISQFKQDKEKLVVKQTDLDRLTPMKAHGLPDPVAKERRRELYAKLDFLDARLARLLEIQLGGFKAELDEHFRSTLGFLDKWTAEAHSTVSVWSEDIHGLPAHKRYEFFEWIQPMFSQLERTCLHYETLLDELSCDLHLTSLKHTQRAGLTKLKSNFKSVTTTALESKNNGNHNRGATEVRNIYAHLGVHTLGSKTFSLAPVDKNDLVQGHLANLIAATNSSPYPSFYGLFNGKQSHITSLVQAFTVVNTTREQVFCAARDKVGAKNSQDFNTAAIEHLKKHRVMAGMIDNLNTWLFYGSSWANIYRAMDAGLPLTPTRFGPAAILLDTVEATNEYIPCLKCGSGDLLTDSLCLCNKEEEYVPVLLCCVMLGNIFLAKRANNEGEDFEQARRHFDSLLIEQIGSGGQGRRRNFVVFNPDLVFVKYLLVCKRSKI